MLDVTRGVQTTNVNTTTIIRSVNPKTFFLQAKTAPLVAMLKRLKKGSNPKNWKFEWVEKDMGTPLCGLTAAVLVGDATINVEAGAGQMFQINDLIYVPSTGEVIKVAATPAADAVSVANGRGYGTTAAAAIAADAVICKLSPAWMEGSLSPDALAIDPSMPFNYTQIFKDSAQATRTEVQTDRYDPKNPKMVQRRKEAMILHMESIERAFLFGEIKVDLTGATPRHLTAGIRSFVTTNVQNCNGAFTKDKFEDFLSELFLYGEGNKVLFASASLIKALNKEVLSSSNMTITPATKEWGLDVRRYLSSFGSIDIVYHRLLSLIHDGYGYALDLDNLEEKALQPTRVKENVAANDYDGFKDEILTETGLEVALEKTHGIIYNP